MLLFLQYLRHAEFPQTKNIKETIIEQSSIANEEVSDESTENISLINTVYENSYLQ